MTVYSINKITLTARSNDIKTITQPVRSPENLAQKTHTIKTHLDHSRRSSKKDNNTQIAYNTLKQ